MIKRVMVSGCFDGLHAGHVCFLEHAASLGDQLIVVLGTDENIRLLKGPTRPIYPLAERVHVIHSLRCVKRILVASGKGKLDFIPELITFTPDIFVVNQDGHSTEKQLNIENRGVKYEVLDKLAYSLFPDRSTSSVYP